MVAFYCGIWCLFRSDLQLDVSFTFDTYENSGSTTTILCNNLGRALSIQIQLIVSMSPDDNPSRCESPDETGFARRVRICIISRGIVCECSFGQTHVENPCRQTGRGRVERDDPILIVDCVEDGELHRLTVTAPKSAIVESICTDPTVYRQQAVAQCPPLVTLRCDRPSLSSRSPNTGVCEYIAYAVIGSVVVVAAVLILAYLAQLYEEHGPLGVVLFLAFWICVVLVCL